MCSIRYKNEVITTYQTMQSGKYRSNIGEGGWNRREELKVETTHGNICIELSLALVKHLQFTYDDVFVVNSFL